MKYLEINLRERFPELPAGNPDARLCAYLHDGTTVERNNTYPAMLVCPGGGYHGLSEREGEPVALAYFAEGFNCFVLKYTCSPMGHFPAQLFEAAAAAYLIRNENDWNNDGRLAVIGFSAGGHLAGSLATRWKMPELTKFFRCAPAILRPDFALLGYPVTCCDMDSHRASFRNLLGPDASVRELTEHDLRNSVDAETPPFFIWHTAEDEGVPVHDSYRFAVKLAETGIPVELHVFPYGAHGLAMADSVTAGRPVSRNPYVHRWLAMSTEWMRYVEKRIGEKK